MSGVQMFYGPDAKTSRIEYIRVEDQEKEWAEAARIGRHNGERLQKQQHGPLNQSCFRKQRSIINHKSNNGRLHHESISYLF
jgi:hypothetical protein